MPDIHATEVSLPEQDLTSRVRLFLESVRARLPIFSRLTGKDNTSGPPTDHLTLIGNAYRSTPESVIDPHLVVSGL